ncbi:MAG: YkgJ family cysteine cluster protein [Myxococcota bacterium]
MSSADSAEGALAVLDDLHREIDRDVSRLSKIHASRLQCRRGCSSCCLDDLSVTPIEAEKIRRAHGPLLRNAEPNPRGACAFLDPEGACRIYEDRPTICRSQGLPLRILFENESAEIEEGRDICSLNLPGGPPLEELDEEECWLVGPEELRVLQLSEQAFGDDEEQNQRIALRDLFV